MSELYEVCSVSVLDEQILKQLTALLMKEGWELLGEDYLSGGDLPLDVGMVLKIPKIYMKDELVQWFIKKES